MKKLGENKTNQNTEKQPNSMKPAYLTSATFAKEMLDGAKLQVREPLVRGSLDEVNKAKLVMIYRANPGLDAIANGLKEKYGDKVAVVTVPRGTENIDLEAYYFLKTVTDSVRGNGQYTITDYTVRNLFGNMAESIGENGDYFEDTAGMHREDKKWVNLQDITDKISEENGSTNTAKVQKLQTDLLNSAKLLADDGIKYAVIHMGRIPYDGDDGLIISSGLHEHGVVVGTGNDNTPMELCGPGMSRGDDGGIPVLAVEAIYKFFAAPFEQVGMKVYAAMFNKDELKPLTIGELETKGLFGGSATIKELTSPLPAKETVVVMDNHAAYHVKTTEQSSWFTGKEFIGAKVEPPVQFVRSVVYVGNQQIVMGDDSNLLYAKQITQEIGQMLGDLD